MVVHQWGNIEVFPLSMDEGLRVPVGKAIQTKMNHLGGLAGMLDKLPGAGNLPSGILDQASQVQTGHLVAIINSMTPRERSYPAVIKGSRKRRIAAGSGTHVQEVNRQLKQFAQLQKMMKKVKNKKGMAQMIGQMQGGGLPGMPPFRN